MKQVKPKIEPSWEALMRYNAKQPIKKPKTWWDKLKDLINL